MENVTDPVFRSIMADYLPKPDVFFTEFTSTDAMCSPRGQAVALEKLRFGQNERPIVAQIWGKNPDHYRQAAAMVQNLGFDGIDINMGCPERNVMKNGCGSALICNFDLVSQIIAAVREGAPNLPLSVKTRIGIKDVVTEQWVSFLLKQKIELLTIHARTAKNMSDVPARWEEIGKAVAIRDAIAPQTLLVGNGDIISRAQAVAMHERYHVDGVMIGRGLFANPWVFAQSSSKTSQTTDQSDKHEHGKHEALQVLLHHVQRFHEQVGDGKKFEMMKKFFKMYIKDFHGASELRQELMACHVIDDVVAVVQRELSNT